MKKLPKARTENLLEQNLKDEMLIYDLHIDKAFNLNETLSVVYEACGRNLSFDELKRRSKFTDDFIYLALDELKRNNLLAEDYRSPFADTSRREVIKKVGLVTMFALPLITGLVAPKATRAASGASGAPALLQSCTQGSEPYCRNSFCISTAGTGDRCCLREYVGSGFVYLPGGTYVDPGNDQPYYALAGMPPPSTESCENAIACCDGSSPTGTCENTVLPQEEQPPDGTYIVYHKTCNCACP